MRSAFLACVSVGLSLFTSSLTAQVQPANVTRPGSRPASPAVSSPALPQALMECDPNQCEAANGGVWVFEGSQGQGMWRAGPVGSLIIEKFDGRTIVVSRADPPHTATSWAAGPDGYFRAVYTGTIHGDEIAGTVVSSLNPANPAPWHATVVKNLCVPFADCPLTMQQMLDLGGNLYQAGLHLAGERCFRVAAEQGDTDGEAYLAFVLYQDKANPAKAAEAFQWATKSAAGNSGLGELLLGRMYQHGIGTTVNLQLAKHWLDKGHADIKQAEEAEAQRQAQQRSQASAQTLVQGLVLGAILAAIVGGSGGSSAADSSDSFNNWQTQRRGADEQDWYRQSGSMGGPPSERL